MKQYNRSQSYESSLDIFDGQFTCVHSFAQLTRRRNCSTSKVMHSLMSAMRINLSFLLRDYHKSSC